MHMHDNTLLIRRTISIHTRQYTGYLNHKNQLPFLSKLNMSKFSMNFLFISLWPRGVAQSLFQPQEGLTDSRHRGV